MTPQEVLEELKNLNISDTDGKIIVDPGIDPLTTSTEQAKTLIEEQINTLVKKGVSPSNIGIIGLDSAFGDLNKAFEEITNSLGAGFGGAFESFMDLDSYLTDLDDIIENKIAGSLSVDAELPENVQLDQGLISKFARTISGVVDIFGEAVVNFPDHMLCEERPIDGKTPLSDWKDRSACFTQTAGNKEWSERKSLFAAQYGKNVIIKSNNGHFIEMDDTVDAERINIQHKNGTFITLMPDKSIVIRSQGGLQQITYKDNDLFVKGNMNITVIGDVNISSNGDTNIDTLGDLNWRVGGDFNLDVIGNTSLFNTTGDIKMTAKQIRQNAGDPRVLDDVKEKTYKLGS